MLENADEKTVKIWNKYQSQFMTKDPNYKGSKEFYSPSDDAVTLNITNAISGSSHQTPYQVLFHEYGHMTDYLISRNNGGSVYTAFTELFDGFDSNGDIIKTSGFGKVGLLGRTAKEELKSKLSEIKKTRGLSQKSDAVNVLINEINDKYSLIERSDVSDMLEGAGIGVAYPCDIGHGKSYWKNRDNGKEIFAEIISAEIANPESLACIKEYFPKTYNVYRSIIERIAE